MRDLLNLAQGNVGFSLRQWNDINRLLDPPEDPFGNAAQECMADRSLPVRPNNDYVGAQFIRHIQNFGCRITLDDVDPDNPLEGLRIVFEFSFGKLFQSFLDSSAHVFFCILTPPVEFLLFNVHEQQRLLLRRKGPDDMEKMDFCIVLPRRVDCITESIG